MTSYLRTRESRPDDLVRYGRRALVGLWADDVKAVSVERLWVSLFSCRKTFNSKVIKFCTWTNFVFIGFLYMFMNTLWTLKRLEKLDGNYTRMLQAILNKSRRQHPTRHQLCGHLPPITKTIQVRRTRHAGDCWRSRDELISDVLQCTHSYGRAKAGRPARTFIQQLCEDTGCSPEDLPEAMNDREKWWERVRDIRASGTTRWW